MGQTITPTMIAGISLIIVAGAIIAVRSKDYGDIWLMLRWEAKTIQRKPKAKIECPHDY